jgi:hypothetical protein
MNKINLRYKRCIILILFILGLGINSCRKPDPVLDNHDVSKVIGQMTAVMIHDVTNPPLAARFFAYSCLSGYQIVQQEDSRIKDLKGVLNGYNQVEMPKMVKGCDYRLSAMLAMLETASKLQPSGSLLLRYRDAVLDSCAQVGFSRAAIDSSMRYAQLVSASILKYAKADRYNLISNRPRYKLKNTPGSWKLTPPAYIVPVEPYFNTIRPLTLDSAAQFLPGPPIPFSADKRSAFYKFLLLSYEKSGDALSQSEKQTANFWDCNPFAVQSEGHMLIGLKKISPGAHWMGITNIACRTAHLSFSRTLEINTRVAIGLLDAFVCCWDAKYRTNRIRPETAIREFIDPNWKPFLQTPPFPEYLSGHSVISAASAVILEQYFGKKFPFTDDVEVPFGIPPRHFNSFGQAAREAAVSRFWGGIHFMDAIEKGLQQGDRVGKWVLYKFK